jgi:hypothetical protein
MGDYIPGTDGGFDLWFNNFKTKFATYAAALGFTPADVLTMTASFAAWQTAMNENAAAQAVAQGKVAMKANQKRESTTLIRNFVKQIQVQPACTDEIRGELGITIAGGRTPAQVPATSPHMALDWSERGRVTIHVGETPTNEAINKFGEYAKHVILQFKVGAGEWEHLGVTSTSPFVHVVGNDAPVTIEYRAAYLNSKGEQGPWGEMDSAYVGAAA